MENKNALKTVLIIIGALVSISAIVVVLYTVFKKYFKVTFECDDCDCCCGDDCFEEVEDYEPICCCECVEEVAEEAAEEGEELAF